MESFMVFTLFSPYGSDVTYIIPCFGEFCNRIPKKGTKKVCQISRVSSYFAREIFPKALEKYLILEYNDILVSYVTLHPCDYAYKECLWHPKPCE